MTIPRDALEKLATPCLIVDLAAADRNIARAAEYFAKRAVKLRPHFKAHKMTTLMRRQIQAGGCCGVTCATPWEATVLASAGIANILVANQVVDPAGLDALARAAAFTRLIATDTLNCSSRRLEIAMYVCAYSLKSTSEWDDVDWSSAATTYHVWPQRFERHVASNSWVFKATKGMSSCVRTALSGGQWPGKHTKFSG